MNDFIKNGLFISLGLLTVGAIIFLASSGFFTSKIFPEGFANDVQIVEKPNSNQSINSPVFINISQIPFPKELDFCGEKVPLHIPEVRERAEREFYLLLQQQGQLALYLKRANRFFPIYERIIKEMNLPDDLKYVSVAESALFQSRSHRDAFGLWQFMEATAREYGLRVDKYVDERANVEKSTRAALTYLQRGHRSFGSWALAAAGYNMGNAGLRRAMTRQNVDNYYDLFLNEETSRFVFRIIIIKELMKNAKKYGIDFPADELYCFGNIRTVKVNGSIPDLFEWSARHKNLYKDVRLLNPWIRTDQLPNGNWEIIIYDK